MKVTIAYRRETSFGFAESKKDKAKFRINVENATKEAVSPFQAKLIRIPRKQRREEKRSAFFKDVIRRRLMLKELLENKYLVLDSDLSRMLDDLLEKGVIQLLEPKRLEDIGRTTDP